MDNYYTVAAMKTGNENVAEGHTLRHFRFRSIFCNLLYSKNLVLQPWSGGNFSVDILLLLFTALSFTATCCTHSAEWDRKPGGGTVQAQMHGPKITATARAI